MEEDNELFQERRWERVGGGTHVWEMGRGESGVEICIWNNVTVSVGAVYFGTI